MKKSDIIWITSVFGVGVLLGWLIWGRQPGTLTAPHTVTTTQTIHDTVPRNIPIPYPFPVKGDTAWYPVPANIDTAVILARYFSKMYYSDTIADTNLWVKIADTISHNAIISRKFDYKWLKPTIINQTTTTNPQPQKKHGWNIYATADASIFANNPVLAPGIVLITPERFGFGIKYDLLNNNPAVTVLYRINK